MMNSINKYHKFSLGFRFVAGFLALAFGLNTLMGTGYAQSVVSLPAAGAMIRLTPAFNPPLIKGLTIYPDNPFQFDFIVDTGDDHLQGKALETESNRLIKYFLASLTVPEDEMWVNLSPYEKNRIIPAGFGQTEMGRDLLAQDYLLKQLTASLMYPEEELGKEFWKKVYAKAQAKFGTVDIPTNTFNKIWIVPEKAVVYVHDKSAFVIESHLKVMLEEDYVALSQYKNSATSQSETNGISSEKHYALGVRKEDLNVVSGVSSEMIREVLLPEIEREVNEGKTFANLRQIYQASILAIWFKQNLKQSLLAQMYVNQNKTKGVDIADKEANQKIYNQYVAAFKKGVYNYIKEDYDAATQTIIPRKYFSGGAALGSGKDILRTTNVLQRDRRINRIDAGFVNVHMRLDGTPQGGILDLLARYAGHGDYAQNSEDPAAPEKDLMERFILGEGRQINPGDEIEVQISYIGEDKSYFSERGKVTEANLAERYIQYQTPNGMISYQDLNEEGLKIYFVTPPQAESKSEPKAEPIDAVEVIEPTYPKAGDMKFFIEKGIGVTAFKAAKPAQNSINEPIGLWDLATIKQHIERHIHDLKSMNVWKISVSQKTLKDNEKYELWRWIREREIREFFEDTMPFELRYMPIMELWESMYDFKDPLKIQEERFADDQPWIRNHRELWVNVLQAAQDNHVYAHGTLNFDVMALKRSRNINAPQHHWILLNLMIEGKVIDGDFGRMTAGVEWQNLAVSPVRFGPDYAIYMQRDPAKKVNREDPIAIFLVPDESVVPFFEEGLTRFTAMGLMTAERAQEARARIMTYGEFVQHQDKIKDIIAGRLTPAQVTGRLKDQEASSGVKVDQAMGSNPASSESWIEKTAKDEARRTKIRNMLTILQLEAGTIQQAIEKENLMASLEGVRDWYNSIATQTPEDQLKIYMNKKEELLILLRANHSKFQSIQREFISPLSDKIQESQYASLKMFNDLSIFYDVIDKFNKITIFNGPPIYYLENDEFDLFHKYLQILNTNIPKFTAYLQLLNDIQHPTTINLTADTLGGAEDRGYPERTYKYFLLPLKNNPDLLKEGGGSEFISKATGDAGMGAENNLNLAPKFGLPRNIQGDGFSIDVQGFMEGRIYTPGFLKWEKANAEKRQTIAVDFDGVLAFYNQSKGKYVVRDEKRAELEQLRAKGYRLVLWSSSADKEGIRAVINQFFPGIFDVLFTKENFSVDMEKQNWFDELKLAYELMNDQQIEDIKSIYMYRESTKDPSVLGYAGIIEDDYTLKVDFKEYSLMRNFFIYMVRSIDQNVVNLGKDEERDRSWAVEVDKFSQEVRAAQSSREKGADDEAMTGENRITNKGGIDLNPAMINLQTKGEMPAYNLVINPPLPSDLKLDGLYPVIINMTPVTNFYQLLGIKKEDGQPQRLSLH